MKREVTSRWVSTRYNRLLAVLRAYKQKKSVKNRSFCSGGKAGLSGTDFGARNQCPYSPVKCLREL